MENDQTMKPNKFLSGRCMWNNKVKKNQQCHAIISIIQSRSIVEKEENKITNLKLKIKNLLERFKGSH